MLLSVVVCTRARPEKLLTCVRSICQNTYQQFELIVVDQSTATCDTHPTILEDRRIRIVPSATVGLARARNLGVSLSKSEIVAFTDDDCIVDPNWIASLLECFESEPDIAAVFGRVLASPRIDEEPTYVHHVTEFGTSTYCTVPSGLFCFALTDFPAERVFQSPCLPYSNLGSGNNMAFRRSALLQLGGFLEELGAGTNLRSAEDTELQYRSLRRRFRILYSPRPLAFHDRWLPPDEVATLMEGYLTGITAAFLLHGLTGDAFAFRIVYFEFVNALKDCFYMAQQNKSYAFKRFTGAIHSWLKGVWGGTKLCIVLRRQGYRLVR